MVRNFGSLLLALWLLAIFSAPGSAAEATPEQLYATLAKLPADQREKRIEEGARKEGKLNFVHTWRGKNAKDHV